MADRLVLPLAEFLDATYLIPVSAAPLDAPGLALEAAGASRHRERLEDELERGTLTVHVRSIDEVPELPIDALIESGASPAMLDLATQADHMVVVHMKGRAGFPASHEWAARTLAAQIGRCLDAPVVDPAIPVLLDWRLAASSDHPGGMRLRDWVYVARPPTGGPGTMTTRGMSRFGFPELQADGFPRALVNETAGVLMALAAGLLNRAQTTLDYNPMADHVELPTLFALGPGNAAVVRLEAAGPARLHMTPARGGLPDAWHDLSDSLFGLYPI